MKTPIASRISTYSAFMSDLFLSAIGCFVLRRCFRLVEEGGRVSETKTTEWAIGQARDPLAYASAALILLALSSDEQPELMSAPSQTHSGNDAAAVWNP